MFVTDIHLISFTIDNNIINIFLFFLRFNDSSVKYLLSKFLGLTAALIFFRHDKTALRFFFIATTQWGVVGCSFRVRHSLDRFRTDSQ